MRITADLETLYGADASAVSKIYLFVGNAYGDYINDTVYYLDNMSVTAVRQLLENNVAAFPEKIKNGFVKFFENLVSFKPPKGMGTITAENFVTSATTAGLLRKDGESAYLTIGDNTLRVSHHNTSVETFEKHR